jgi:CDGSH-type Zn-finger protein
MTLDQLRQHLQWAIELEHATIPPYLCALYSIKPGSNKEAVANIASVFIEEMLHMTLAANVLNAIGGRPVLDSPTFTPRYPAHLPHSADRFLVNLEPFTPQAIDTFLKIEKPEDDDAPAEADQFHTIGQFYRAIEEALKALCGQHGESQVFCGNPVRQITPALLPYSGSGRIIPVYDLASALAAIDEIEDQGEGLRHHEVWDGDRDMFHPERDEVAHYFRFIEITRGRLFQRGDTPQSGPSGAALDLDWAAVYPMRPNPRLADYPAGHPVRIRMQAFNELYSGLLRDLHRAFNGEPGVLLATMSVMWRLRDAAQALMQMPTGDGATTAGPSFEYVPPQPAQALAGGTAFSVRVEANGPYVVSGGVPLVRKSIVYSELHEPLTWRKDAALDAGATYRLCRCGHSATKPFCDNTHLRIEFDGTESAPLEPSADRARRIRGRHINVTDDAVLCTHAGFCGNHKQNVWGLVGDSGDTQVRFQMIQMIERCPSGRLGYSVDDGAPIEPDLPAAVAVTKDGPYWVTGRIPVTQSDGHTLEVRNRVTLCRCGQSSIKPLCDGTHRSIKFREG